MENSEDQLLDHQTEQGTTIQKGNQNSTVLEELKLKSEKRVILYSAAGGKVTANVFFALDTFWMTQKICS